MRLLRRDRGESRASWARGRTATAERVVGYCRERGLRDILGRTNDADEHLDRFYRSFGFMKLDVTAQPDTSTFSVTKRYFLQSPR